MNEILASKYRPMAFSEVIGQEVPVRLLSNALLSNKLYNSYIFYGRHGCGKTSLARILAMSENCKNGPTLTPCGVCTSCKNIISSKSIDVREIDAASNGGVDSIRAIKEESYYAPIESKVKYYIIDEAHSLTNAAFEAALKLIEEPPSFVRFILCTTEFNSIPDTIKSRCCDILISPVSWQALNSNILEICKKENISIDENASILIAKNSKNSVRNSLRNLEKIKNYCNSDKIDVNSVVNVLGIINETFYYDIVDSIINKNFFDVFKNTNNILLNTDPDTLVNGILSYLRKLLIIKLGQNSFIEREISTDEIKKIEVQASKIDKTLIISKMIGLLPEIKKGIIYNIDSQVLIEKWAIDSMAIIAIANKTQV